MESNNSNQGSTFNQPLQQSTPDQPVKQNFSPALIAGVIILLAIVGSGTYYLGTKKNQPTAISQTETINNIATPTPTIYPNSTKSTLVVTIPEETTSWKSYTASSEYTFSYPSDWKVVTDTSQFSYLALRSPDYSVDTDGIEVLQKGAEIYITAKTANNSTIDEEFAKDSLGQQVAQNKRYVTVDGQRALQYDFSYESNTATDTRLIKNNMSYLIQYKYPKVSDMQTYLKVYTKLLESFNGL
jgi:hypothetical protein